MNDRRDDIRKWRVAVTSHDYRMIVKRVALVLADEFGIDGMVGISYSVLATRADVSKDTVKKVLKELVADGFLNVTESTEPDGSAGPNFYSIPVAAEPVKKKAPAKKAPKSADTTDADVEPEAESDSTDDDTAVTDAE